jgi:hypothetical protein
LLIRLTLTGTATTAQYQQALRSVTFFSPFTLLGRLPGYCQRVAAVVVDGALAGDGLRIGAASPQALDL